MVWEIGFNFIKKKSPDTSGGPCEGLLLVAGRGSLFVALHDFRYLKKDLNSVFILAGVSIKLVCIFGFPTRMKCPAECFIL